MNEDIIATMEAEEAELARKLDAVRQFLAAYRGGSVQGSPKSVKKSVKSRPARSADDRLDKFGPYGQRIVDFVDRVLPGCDANPVPTRQIVEYLTSQNIEVTGENKVNSLSALLARSSKMKGWGRAGWTRSAPEDGAHLVQMQISGSPPAQNANGEAVASPDADEVSASSDDAFELVHETSS